MIGGQGGFLVTCRAGTRLFFCQNNREGGAQEFGTPSSARDFPLSSLRGLEARQGKLRCGRRQRQMEREGVGERALFEGGRGGREAHNSVSFKIWRRARGEEKKKVYSFIYIFGGREGRRLFPQLLKKGTFEKIPALVFPCLSQQTIKYLQILEDESSFISSLRLLPGPSSNPPVEDIGKPCSRHCPPVYTSSSAHSGCTQP